MKAALWSALVAVSCGKQGPVGNVPRNQFQAIDLTDPRGKGALLSTSLQAGQMTESSIRTCGTEALTIAMIGLSLQRKQYVVQYATAGFGDYDLAGKKSMHGLRFRNQRLFGDVFLSPQVKGEGYCYDVKIRLQVTSQIGVPLPWKSGYGRHPSPAECHERKARLDKISYYEICGCEFEVNNEFPFADNY